MVRRLLAVVFTVALVAGCGSTGPAVTGTVQVTVRVESEALPGVQVTLDGTTGTTGGAGTYSFTDVSKGSHLVEISGFPADAQFSVTSRSVSVATEDEVVSAGFDGTWLRTSSITGVVSTSAPPGSPPLEGPATVGPLSGVTVSVTGTESGTAVTNSSGQYTISNIRAGNYTAEVTFDGSLYTFPNNGSQSVSLAIGQTAQVNFAGTDIPQSPVVTDFGLAYVRQTQGCPAPANAQIFAFFDYTDPNQDFLPGSQVQLSSTLSGGAQAILASVWTRLGGSSNAVGTEAILFCLSIPDAAQDFMDVQVEIRDFAGNMALSQVVRLMFPKSVVLNDTNPGVAPGTSFQFTTEVRDVNNDIIPDFPPTWSQYNGPLQGSISPEGLFTATPGFTCFERVYARAGLAWGTSVPMGSIAPDCWEVPNGQISPGPLTLGEYKYFRMMVYAGKEYTFATDGTGSGDIDLYIRLGARPTTATFDDLSIDVPPNGETITWTAPSDGLLWIAMYGFSASSSENLTAITTDGMVGFPVPEMLPAASPGPGEGSPVIGWEGAGGFITPLVPPAIARLAP